MEIVVCLSNLWMYLGGMDVRFYWKVIKRIEEWLIYVKFILTENFLIIDGTIENRLNFIF